MIFKVFRTDSCGLENVLNSYCSDYKLFNIYPEHVYNGTLFVVVFVKE